MYGVESRFSVESRFAVGRRSALAATLLTALWVVLLAGILNSATGMARVPVPAAVYIGLAVAYLLVACISTGVQLRRAAVVFGIMLITQGLMTLFAGLIYIAMAGNGVSVASAWVYALSDYLPGLLLQAVVVFLMGPVVAAWWGGPEAEEQRHRIAQLPAFSPASSVQDALETICRSPDIAGVLLCEGEQTLGGGIWRRDPDAACGRVRVLASATDKDADLFVLGDAAVAVSVRKDRLVAVALPDADTGYLASTVTRRLHRVARRLPATAPTQPDADRDADGDKTSTDQE